MLDEVAMQQVQPGIKWRHIHYTYRFKTNSDRDHDGMNSCSCHHTKPLTPPQRQLVSLTAESVCPTGLRPKAGFRPQLLNVLPVLSIAIGSEISHTVGGALEATVPF